MNLINRCKPLLGTYVETSISGSYSNNSLLEITDVVFKKIKEIESLMNFYDKSSELSYINSNAYYKYCNISDEVAEVVDKSLEISKLTDGFYDITVDKNYLNKNNKSNCNPNWTDVELTKNKIKFKNKIKLDLGGIAKGYAVDKALLSLKNYENIDVLINAGGDLVMNNWSNKFINIKIPSSKNKVARVKMRNQALATSEPCYFSTNKNSIICNKTKKIVDDKRSISVFAPNCMIADALTKVVFLYKDCASVVKNFGAEFISINKDGIIS